MFAHLVKLLSLAVMCALLAVPVAAAETPARLLEKAAAAAEKGDHGHAVALATSAIDLDATVAEAFYLRGRERFCLGQIEASLEDFDRYVALNPAAAPRQWERGIACYYAAQYEEGAKQFELYQTFDGHDVENSIWRFLCMTPKHGVERAKSLMLPVTGDRRVPMKEVYELYRGQLKPEDVLAAAHRDSPPPEVLAGRLFYAHLYLGLWHEAHENRAEARRYIELAADDKLRDNPRLNRYMWEVARVHRQKLK